MGWMNKDNLACYKEKDDISRRFFIGQDKKMKLNVFLTCSKKYLNGNMTTCRGWVYRSMVYTMIKF